MPYGHDRESLKDYLEKTAGRMISLILTDNASSLMSVRTQGNLIFVRLQRILLDAGMDVIDEIASFIKNGRGKTPHLREYVNHNTGRLRKQSPGRQLIKTRGNYHNLSEIYDLLNKEYFSAKVSSTITWGIRPSRRAVKKRTLGSYDNFTNTIRINPVLDRRSVPRYFVVFVVYHEMLHADMGFSEVNGRRSVHSKEFRSREKALSEYQRARAWEKKYFR